MDIYTHVDDGPLMLWPFEWTQRFESPISHWDLSAYGSACLAVETSIMAEFVITRIMRRHAVKRRRTIQSPI